MTPITYISTRGRSPELAFDDVLLAGLAPDGGLYVPSHLPHFTPADLHRLSTLPYHDLAYEIIAPFIGNALDATSLRSIINDSYATFRHKAVAPLKHIGHNSYLLELFHGPTLAFKDVALQCLGRVMDSVLAKRNERLVIVGATSGDTGSAAIAGCQGRDHMDIIILYPHGRVSDVQRRQMTTVTDSNVHCIAIDGTFDDCQHLVKTLFVDGDFRKQHPLGAVNSINWMRIIAQIVYYFYAAFQLGAPARGISFCVPTGNFGNIYAGYLAKSMGLPLEQFIIASNRNDILTRCLNTGAYTVEDVQQTLSPSMDIGVSSNFERLMFDLHNRDADCIDTNMQTLKDTGTFTLSDDAYRRLTQDFCAVRADDNDTQRAIEETYRNTGELIDPHTAVGVHAMQQQTSCGNRAYVTLATAHPAKFPDAVKKATSLHPELPTHLADLFERDERFTRMDNNIDAIKAYIRTI